MGAIAARQYREDLTDKSKNLRNEPTEAERYLWSRLKNSQMCGCKFRRQQPLGKYIADFVCFEKALVIEIDGGQHSENEPYDQARDDWLENEGFIVLRFWNNEVLGNLAGVVDVIMEELE